MTDAAPSPQTLPAGCTSSDVERWRAVVGAARLLARRPTAKAPGLRKIIKDGNRAVMPFAERRRESAFNRLIRQLAAWPSLDPAARPARAAELGQLAEAVAQALGDEHDAEVAARVVNPVRPRADLDN